MAARKLIGQIHLWIGLVTGFVIVILGITGCLYAFTEELKPLIYKDRMFIEVPENAMILPISILKENAQIAVGKKYPLQNAEISTDPGRTFSFRARKINKKPFCIPITLNMLTRCL